MPGMPRPKVGAPPPPPATAKPKAIRWSDKQKASQRLQRLLSFQIVQKWRDDVVSTSTPELDWSAVDCIVYVAGGSGGVLLARFHGAPPRLCCLKPQRMDAHAELCASVLADALQVRTASLQVVQLSADIAKALREARLAIDDHAVYRDRLLADARYLGIVEFVNGPMMEGEEFVKIFEEGSGALFRFWTEAGILIALDCLINNLDRLPIIWDNSGNLKNLMVESSARGPLRVVGIDQAVRGISAASGLERYVERLRCLLRVVLASENEWLESPCLLRVQTAIQANFQNKFQVHASALKIGLQQAFRRFAWSWCSRSLQRSLDEAMNKVMATFGCGAEQLLPLRRTVEVAAATVADEVHKAQLSIIPHPILEVFRRCIPSGQLSRDQMVSLLRELDPSLEMREVQKFMVDSFSDSACVDCTDFLLLLWSRQRTE